MFPALDERLWARDGLFPVAMRRWLPSFYFWDFSSYWTYAPNVVAIGIVGSLLLIGARAARAAAPSRASQVR